MLSFKLYDRTLSTDTIVESLTGRVSKCVFSSKMPGGFAACEGFVGMPLLEAEEWYNRLNYRLKISEESTTIWEGRIEEAAVESNNLQVGVAFTAYGYYANCRDVPYNTAFNDVASAVIGTVLAANCVQVATTSHLSATSTTINSVAGDDYTDLYPADLFAKLLGMSSGGPWDFAVWQDREAWLTQRSVTSADWYCDSQTLQNFSCRVALSEMYNQAYALYTVAGATTRTNTASSTNYYGLTRQYAVPDLQNTSSTAAEAARDYILTCKARAWPEVPRPIVIGKEIYDIYGAARPAYFVRAGQVIRIRDLFPAASQLAGVSRDRLTTFWISETSYDVDRDELSLTLESPAQSLEARLLA